jgi:hypothetical protein
MYRLPPLRPAPQDYGLNLRVLWSDVVVMLCTHLASTVFVTLTLLTYLDLNELAAHL